MSVYEQVSRLIQDGESISARKLLEQNQDDRVCLVRLRELLIGEADYGAAIPVAEKLALGDDVEAMVSRSFLALLKGHTLEALQECGAAAKQDENNPSLHNHAGRALHNAGQPDKSVEAFQRAISLNREYPEAWHNLGHVMRAIGNLEQASTAYARALEQAPGYRSARLNLGKTLFNQESIGEALEQFDLVLQEYGDDPEALTDGGLALHLLGRQDEAKQYYDRALQVDTGNPQTWLYLGILENELQDADAATTALEKSIAIDPNNVEAWIELAATHELCNRLIDAEAAIERGKQIAGFTPALQLEAAKLERRKAGFNTALEMLLAIDLKQLPGRLERPYYFELAQVYDRLEKTDDAYRAYRSGNELGQRDVRRKQLSGRRYLQSLNRLSNWIDEAPFEFSVTDGDKGTDLCFLHGFMRSGTTLLDMMLDVHPHLTAFEEVPSLEDTIRSYQGMGHRYPEDLGTLNDDTVMQLRQRYHKTLAARGGVESGQIVVDKMPMRFIHTVYLNQLFPESRVLFALRHPCDVVLSNFMQQYPSTSDLLVNFDTLEAAANVYHETFSLWRKVEHHLTIPVHYVRYEDLVADGTTQISAICDFLGVEMVPEMMDLSSRMATRGRVITPSYQQVSEPIYDRAAERWRRYSSYLEPVLPMLAEHCDYFGYEL